MPGRRQKHEKPRRGTDRGVEQAGLHFAQELLRPIAGKGEVDDALLRFEIGELLRQRIGVVEADAEGDGIAEEGDGRSRTRRTPSAASD